MNPDDLAEYYGKDESKVPFEYLDPCCQQEILERRHHEEVGDRLRVGDRSLRRWDAGQTVFSQVEKSAWQCGCCTVNVDYSSLRALKGRLDQPPAPVAVDSDEEEDDPDFMIPLTPAEQERMGELARLMATRKRAEDSVLRLGQHLDESVTHLLTLVQRLPDLPIIVHVYQDNDQNALIDYTIERCLAPKYLGSMFRRLSVTAALPFQEMNAFPADLVEAFNTALVEHRHCLLAFRRGQLVSLTAASDLELHYHGLGLMDKVQILTTHLRTLLDHAHVLSEDLPQELFNPQVLIAAGLHEAEPKEKGFCDDPDCSKRYPHEHVGKRRTGDGGNGEVDGSGSGSGPSFLLSKDKGQEVFAEGALQRV